MTDFILYQGKAAIVLATFYMFYRLLLSKDTFHRFNRIVLLGTAALSFILPLCVITIKKVVVLPAMSAGSETIVGEAVETVAMTQPIWPVILCSIFSLGALLVLANVIVSIFGIKRIIGSGSRQALENGETLIITENDTAPFSWMKYIVISREDYESGYSQILTHEKAHIALRHSWDILFVDMITALQWFNPAIWMLKADLRALHEFEADDAVLRSGANVKEYQYLLIRKAVSKSGYSIANSFNHSTLKARITMMSNKKSSRMSAWKALYIILLVGISLAATAETKVDYRYEDQQPVVVADTLKGKVSKISLPEHKSESTKKSSIKFRTADGKEGDVDKNDLVFVVNDEIMPAGFDLNTIDPNTIESMEVLKTEKALAEYGTEKGVIIITTDPSKANEKKPLPDVYIDGKKATSEDIKALPANPKGYVEADGTIRITTEDKKDDIVVAARSVRKPSFNGGTNADFAKWVQENIRYPEGTTAEGRVAVSFTVSETGKVTNVKALRGPDQKLSDEAVRVISSSPDWAPATNEDGKPVAIKLVIPVDFKK